MKETIGRVNAIIEEAEAMKNAYFFHSPSTAGSRRSYEKKHTHARVTWTEGGHEYSAEYTVACSCANVYATGKYTRDGQRTTLTAIKNSLKRMVAAAVAA